MPEPITVHKDSEFFISIAKKGVHSFIMVGVMINGHPEILARVGKGNLIDKQFGVRCTNRFTIFGKNIFHHSDASLLDEFDFDKNRMIGLSYQSYSITLKQYKEFIAITRDIHHNQLAHYQDRNDPVGEDKYLTYPELGVRKLRQGISCYIPEDEEGGQVTFTYKNIHSFNEISTLRSEQERQQIIARSKEINASNTCRTTAYDLLQYPLPYAPKVPSLFLMELDYKTTLSCSKLNPGTFYILPPPPNCFQLNPTQMKVLEKLYKKLEDLPKKQSGSDVTRKKFEALKQLYKELAGEPQLSLTNLLEKITLHRKANHDLFNEKRDQCLFSKFVEAVGFKINSGTQRTYDQMEKDLKEEIHHQTDACTQQNMETVAAPMSI
ncbi:Uncharacterised protein [Legionella wadsworthii]|uniref:Uncharacterized protein n=1 Tax=Legionella wadsworthii TaxID=28088 RepID=A0A378LMX7_9GAMM|nr:hypothetical protein [Legionella wadsworthii]STY28266.1 Uncharacterised protein [Legionella wadsworthii]